MADPLDGIPDFLRRSNTPEAEAKRVAEWDRYMATRKVPPPLVMPEIKRIIDPPGAAPHDDT